MSGRVAWRRGAWGAVLAIVVCARMARAGNGLDGAPSLGVTLASPTGGFSAYATGRTPAVSFGPLAGRLGSSGLAISDGPGGPGARLQLEGRAELRVPYGAAWLGAGIERRSSEERASSSPLLEAGALKRLGAVVITTRVSHTSLFVPQAPVLVTSWTSPPEFHSPPDTIPIVPYWEPREARRAAITSLESVVGWTHSRWQIEAWTGLALGQGITPIRIARMQATRWLGPDLGLALGLRSAGPHWLGARIAERPAAELGLRIEPGGRSDGSGPKRRPSPAGPRWSMVRLASGRYAVRVNAPEAGRVALRGDFTGWEPVELGRAGPGWWEAMIELAPGLHQFQVSVDGGAWQAPPGTSTATGTYGDEVGVVVAR